MVVVEPNRIVVGADDFKDFVCEKLVDGNVGLPERAIEAGGEVWGEGEEVVE